jgi:arylsulfatase A-like enzyme
MIFAAPHHLSGTLCVVAFTLLFSPGLSVCSPARETSRPNILFIAVDDLRAQLGCYGDAEVQSPNIDRLAGQGVLFERAYCNIPRCGASRASILTGIRAPADIWNCYEIPLTYVTLPAWFSKHEYHTVSNGKVLHYLKDRKYDWDEVWRSAEVYFGEEDWGKYNTYGIWQNPESGNSVNPASLRGPYCERAEVDDEAYQDGKVAEKTIADLERLGKGDQPFFLACGFWRPHLPFNAPAKYWDLYERDRIQLADNPYPPRFNPAENVSAQEFERYARTGDIKATAEFQAEARHAYYACISYVDAQIGKVLDALDRLNLRESTVVVLWSDHGFLLGEHSFWGKQNTMRESLQVPLIISAPGLPRGARTDALVELVDLYPTLCELSDLPLPDHLHGKSLVPLLQDPELPGREAVFSRFSGCESIITGRYSYTEWRDESGGLIPMLFDHESDPGENENIAGRSDASEVVERLSLRIKQELLRTQRIDGQKFQAQNEPPL